ncbi:uncharacterized protein [Anabrus simplex]|uniref:uncharacterized protein n=1 Tax=Anabrus simplex TaxID=316456 RepID=UPI0035A2D593
MRRHAPPHEAASSPYYPAPMQPPRGYPPENGGKLKKGWGERLRLSKGDKGPPTTLLDEYRNKYGTLSSGSALSKSMKYAETWLYGSVSIRHGTNGVLLCPPPHHLPVVPPCACAEFLAGTQSGKKAAAAVCKKCGGSRVVWGPPGGTVRGTAVGTLRLGGGGQARVRPSLISLTPPPQPHPNHHPQPLPPQKAVTPDPYDLMRRNRLGSVTIAEGPPPQFIEPNGRFISPSFAERARARSTSPGRRSSQRSPSPTMRLARYSPENKRRSSRRDISWVQSSVELSPDTSKRKSILECDVNAYELIAKYLKNGVPPPTEDGPETSLKGRFESVASDEDVLDDELSDNLSDNALENETVKKNRATSTKSPCPSHHKTDLKHTDKFSQRKKLQDNVQKSHKNTTSPVNTNPKLLGVEKLNPVSGNKSPGVTTIGGQTIRIFCDNSHSLIREDDDFGSEEEKDPKAEMSRGINISEEDCTTEQKMFAKNSSSQIPRPRRPPRKQKSCSPSQGLVDRNESQRAPEDEEIESESTVTFKEEVYSIGESSPLHAGISRGERRGTGASSAEGSTIKSILKKPSLSPPASETFGDTILKPDCNCSGSTDQPHSPSPAISVATDFYLPTFQEFKQQNRKKKQVQFKVVTQDDGSCEQIIDEQQSQVHSVVQSESQGVGELHLTPTQPPDSVLREINYVPSASGASTPQEEETSLSDLRCSTPKPQFFGDSNEDASVVNNFTSEIITSPGTDSIQIKGECAPSKDSIPRTGPAKSSRTSGVTLRRSHSDRQPSTCSGDKTGRDVQSRRHSNKQQLFNDTMRLRLRTGGRPDSRQLFDVNFVNAPIPKRPQRMLSPGRPRPKEPPPPPPPPAPNTPTTTTEPPLPPPFPPPELPRREIFPFTKEEIENINLRKVSQFDEKFEFLDEKISSVEALSAVSTGNNFPPTTQCERRISSSENHSKSRPNSWSPPHLTSSSPDDISFESIGELGSRKKEHRHSDPGPRPSKLRLRCESTPHLDKALSKEDHPSVDERNSEEAEVFVRTIVTVSPAPPSPSDVHRLQVSSQPVSYQIEVSPHPQRRTSILINGSDGATVNKNQSSRTSVIIEDSSRSSTPCRDENKVTINVGGMNNDNKSTSLNSSSSCTVIDTSSTRNSNVYNNNSSSFSVMNHNVTNVSTNQIVIPVTPDDQKTRVFLDHCSNVEVSGNTVNGESSSSCWSDTSMDNKTVDVKYTPSTVLFVEGDNESYNGSASNVVVGSKSLRSIVIEPSDEIDEDDTAAILLDPVEAIKRNLIPHVCGKKDDEVIPSTSSAVDRLSSLINQAEDNISEKLKENDYYMAAADAKLLDPSDDLKDLLRSDSVSTDHSENCDPMDDRSSSSCDQITAKNDDDHSTSDLALSRPHFVIVAPEIPEKDKQEAEVELKGCNDENLYESIKDPIYEEIPETPPPLPLSPPPSIDDIDDDKRGSRSIFEGASKYDILSYLEGAKERGIVPEESDYGGSANDDEVTEAAKDSLGDLSSRVSHLSNTSDSSEDSCNLIIADDAGLQNKVRKSSAEIERNDSGVGSETSKSSRSRWQPVPAGTLREDQQLLCEDCDQRVETQVTDSGVIFAPLVCRKCGKKRAERKEIIAEIVETEDKYSRDLQIILDEFYRPMLVAGLLTSDQLGAIFLNVEELLENAIQLSEKLRDTLEIAVEQGDEDLLTVNMGKIFLEAAPMLHAFESYCTRQAAASLLLANLEKEKELLRIFLRVSQMENAVLRRMNLNSFLMVPVQRVTKYPLLLARLYKVTPAHHQGRDQLKQAQHKIELHLEHMNSEAKDVTTTKLWRRISIINLRRPSSETDMIIIKLRKMALDILEWNPDEIRFAMEGKLFFTNPTDNNWRRGRTVKLNPINAVLVTKGKPLEDYPVEPPDEPLMFAKKNGVREATLLLVKEKCGRYSLLRDPLSLDKCIVCCDTDWEDYFEVQELATKETYIFRGEDGERTKAWYRQLQYHAQGLGAWRRRRNALANIMINGMLTRS